MFNFKVFSGQTAAIVADEICQWRNTERFEIMAMTQVYVIGNGFITTVYYR